MTKGLQRSISRTPGGAPSFVKMVRVPVTGGVSIIDVDAHSYGTGIALLGLPDSRIKIIGAYSEITLTVTSGGILDNFTGAYSIDKEPVSSDLYETGITYGEFTAVDDVAANAIAISNLTFPVLNGVFSPIELYLNVRIDYASQTSNGALSSTGFVNVYYIELK